MTGKPTPHEIAQHVLDYAHAKQLRGGWDNISECYSLDELAEFLYSEHCQTKADGLAKARAHVKVWSNIRREERAMANAEARGY